MTMNANTDLHHFQQRQRQRQLQRQEEPDESPRRATPTVTVADALMTAREAMLAAQQKVKAIATTSTTYKKKNNVDAASEQESLLDAVMATAQEETFESHKNKTSHNHHTAKKDSVQSVHRVSTEDPTSAAAVGPTINDIKTMLGDLGISKKACSPPPSSSLSSPPASKKKEKMLTSPFSNSKKTDAEEENKRAAKKERVATREGRLSKDHISSRNHAKEQPRKARSAASNRTEPTSSASKKMLNADLAIIGCRRREVQGMDLQVTILQGENLAAKDRNLIGQKTSSDPYCVVELQTLTSAEGGNVSNTQKLGQTKTVMKNLSPEWNDSFALDQPLPAEALNKESPPTLVLKIFDYDFGTADDIMGVVTIPIDILSTGQCMDTTEWYNVPESSAPHATGRLKVAIKRTLIYNSNSNSNHHESTDVVKTTDSTEKTALKKKAPPRKARSLNDSSLREHRRGVRSPARMTRSTGKKTPRILHGMNMKVTVLRGEDLAAKDWLLMGLNASSDPYVVVELQTTTLMATENGKVEPLISTQKLGQTKTVMKTLSPEWNDEFSLEEPVPAQALLDKKHPPTLVFKIFDYDFGTADDRMGIVTIPIDVLLGDQDVTEWYDVPESSAHGASGRLQIGIQSTFVYKECNQESTSAASDTADPESPKKIESAGMDESSRRRRREGMNESSPRKRENVDESSRRHRRDGIDGSSRRRRDGMDGSSRRRRRDGTDGSSRRKREGVVENTHQTSGGETNSSRRTRRPLRKTVSLSDHGGSKSPPRGELDDSGRVKREERKKSALRRAQSEAAPHSTAFQAHRSSTRRDRGDGHRAKREGRRPRAASKSPTRPDNSSRRGGLSADNSFRFPSSVGSLEEVVARAPEKDDGVNNQFTIKY